MKYLIIDGNNLGCRSSFAFRNLAVDLIDYTQDFNPDSIGSSKGEFPTGAIHGFLRNVAAIRRNYPDRYIVVAWDGKSKARVEEAKAAVAKGIVPSGYKSNRPENERSPEVAAFHQQKPIIMEALSMTNIPQIVKKDEEADDIIASLVTSMPDDDVMVLTGDKDYYQLFRNQMTILESGGNILTEAWFRQAYGISPAQWVDVGALMGDDGDSIHGIPFWGEVTATKAIVQYGTCEAVLSSLHAEFDNLRVQYPDVCGDEFNTLKELKTPKGKLKFPHLKLWMPFTGVALANENGSIKIPRSSIMALVYESRVALAKSLKGMHRNIKLPNLPVDLERDKVAEFKEICGKYGLREVSASAELICSRQVQS